MNLGFLIRGLPGHPLHPPLTDAVIGAYTFGTIAAVLDALDVTETAAAQAWWLALLVGLVLTVPTAATGIADWLTITNGTPLWRTATTHLIVMLLTAGVFLATVIAGKPSYDDGDVGTGALVLNLVGFGLLLAGGWIGGAITYVHGMRVLNLVDEPASKAVAPTSREKREAARD